jgi:leucyl-tRNA synthetase
MHYDFRSIEEKWQAHWTASGTFRALNPGDAGFDPAKPKYYVLDMFPYPSGVGLHVGHPLGYIATDILARYKRMKGFNVLHPMGYDAFGLPAEQFAVEHGVHPRITTEKNIANMTRQLKRLGLSYDWDRCLSTTDVDYYKWTQWIFLQLYNAWFDPSQNKARPISELMNALADEDIYVGLDGELIPSGTDEDLESLTGLPVGARKWHELDAGEQRRLLDEYRLAYLAEVPVNWCPALGTVLANEEVTNEGRSERGNHPVFKRPLKQWMLRITAFAQRLGDDLALIDWPEPIKLMQRNWIGRSDGAHVDFAVAGSDESIRVFTTRPDTLFGATYMVLSPEHELVSAITTPTYRAAVDEYRAAAASRTDADRTADTKTKTGVFTGAYAINPVNREKIPIWIADYVLTGYGTGAIMAVPAHDQRDHDFASTFKLPIVQVITAPAGIDVQANAWEGDGVAMNSENAEINLNGANVNDAKKLITAWLQDEELGSPQVQYKLRDWLFSRQRYWGEPFPILHGEDGEIVALDASELPVELPPMEHFQPHASDDPHAPVQTPLSRAPDSWKHVTRNGKRYVRELNTMPQWAGSCWYYLRFCDPKNSERFVGQAAEKQWMVSEKRSGQPHSGGVDMYVGGAEHAVLHLLYSRFWHKVLFDLGHVSTPEPFGRLFNQGYIQAYAYTDSRGVYLPAEEVEEAGGAFTHKGQPVNRLFGKMGKSLKNAVTPDEICDQYGCDTMRLYEMYLGPLDQSKLWNTRDIVGVNRFLQRLWRNFISTETNSQTGAETHAWRVTDEPAEEPLRRLLHRTIKRVTDDMERMSFNTAIAALIELNNELVGREALPREIAESLVLLLSPLAPHIAEELWSRLGHAQPLAHAPWPKHDPTMLVEATIEYVVQLNGKVRGRVTVATDADDKTVEAAALGDPAVVAAMEGKVVRKVIVVKKKLVNLVV